MERLIKDANEIRRAQGLSADLTIEKYSDVIEAIHAVQENMGIAGTTQKEAADTIEGSLKSTGAAWQNLLTTLGRGQGVKQATKNLVASAKNVIKNIKPIAVNALKGIGELLQELGPVIISELPSILDDTLPALISAVGSLVGALARALPGILASVGRALWGALQTIWASLTEQYPILGEIAEKIGGFLTGAWDTAKKKWEEAKAFFSGLWSDIQNNETFKTLKSDLSGVFANAGIAAQTTWKAAQAFFSGLWGLIQGDLTAADLAKSLEAPFSTAWNAISATWAGIVQFFDDLWAGLENDPELGGLFTILIAPFKSAWTWVKAIWNSITGFFSTLWSVIQGEKSLNDLAEALLKPFTDAYNSVVDTWTKAVEALAGYWSQIENNETLGGLAKTIAAPFRVAWSVVKLLWSTIGGFFSGIWGVIKGEKTLGELMNDLSKPFSDAWKNVKNEWKNAAAWFGQIWDDIKNNEKLTAILDAIKQPFVDAWNQIMEINWVAVGQTILLKIRLAFITVTEWLREKFNSAADAIKSIEWDKVGEWIWNAIAGAFRGIRLKFAALFVEAKEGAKGVNWKGLGESILNIITSVFSGIGDTLVGFIKAAFSSITGIDLNEETITGTLKAILAGIMAYESVTTITAIIQGLKAAFAAFKAGIGLFSIGNPVALAIGGAATAIMLLWQNSEGFRNVVGGIWDAIQKFIEDPSAAIKGAIDAISSATSKVYDWFVYLKDNIAGVFESILSTVKEWWGKIVEPIQTAIDKIKEFLGLQGEDHQAATTKTLGGAEGSRETIQHEGGGSGTGRVKYNADAMTHGKILHGLTPFGIDRKGVIQMGGEAGDEAVVGVKSLRGMIQQSVDAAVGGLRLQVVLDSGVLVGEIAPKMNDELNTIADWNGGGHA